MHAINADRKPRPAGTIARVWYTLMAIGLVAFAFQMGLTPALYAQENPLDTVQTKAPPPPKPTGPPVVKETPQQAAANATSHPDVRIRVDTNLVIIPATVTDPMNRLVTGLERDNFTIYEDNVLQPIKSFSVEDSPVSIGIIFDLSGSMSSKITNARHALSEFLRTANPQDEFFVIGFNDRPQVIVDYTSNVDDIEARMMQLKPENRTALLDAIYMGVDKLKQSKYERRAMIIVSDGGDNRSRYSERELRNAVRESDLQIYAIGIFDFYATTPEEVAGPMLLTDICDMTGGRMFRASDTSELGDIATAISSELRNQYVIGYKPLNVKQDATWRKVKVRLQPPPGLPLLTVHARNGYYAPSP